MDIYVYYTRHAQLISLRSLSKLKYKYRDKIEK